jgi:hypothetical protein
MAIAIAIAIPFSTALELAHGAAGKGQFQPPRGSPQPLFASKKNKKSMFACLPVCASVCSIAMRLQ